MSGLGLVLVFVAALAGADEAGKTPSAADSGMVKSFVQTRAVKAPVTVNVVGVLATTENRSQKSVDPELGSVKAALSDLPFDTYRKLCDQTLSAPFGQETRCTLNERYTLVISPISREANGQVRLNLSVEMAPKNPADKPVVALSTTLVIAPDRQFKLRGLKAGDGEVVAVISLKGPLASRSPQGDDGCAIDVFAGGPILTGNEGARRE